MSMILTGNGSCERHVGKNTCIVTTLHTRLPGRLVPQYLYTQAIPAFLYTMHAFKL